jgi:hypothetical protein
MLSAAARYAPGATAGAASTLAPIIGAPATNRAAAATVMPNLRTMTAAVRVALAAASAGLVRRVLSLCSAFALGSSIIIISPWAVGRMIRPEIKAQEPPRRASLAH